jgi:hypothetical protein
MNAKRLSCLSIPLIMLWLLSLPAQAAVEAGRILFARGTVSIVDENQSARGGSVGSVFYEGDRIVTGNNSIAQLRLSDGALTALRSHSNYQIQRQRFDEANKVYEQAGRLVAGWMRSVTGAIGARYPGNVQQGTAVATIGIRGTTYQIIHVPEEGLPEFPNLQPGTYVYLESGQIEVSNEAGSRIVNPGQVVRISGANVEPELAPELIELFQSQLLSSIEGDGEEGFSVRDLLEGTEDVLVDTLAGSAPQPFSGTVSGVGAFGGNFANAGRALSANLVWTGEGASRYIESMIIDASNGETLDPYDLASNGLGSVSGTQYRQILGADGLASQIHWGLWTEGNFDLLDSGGLPVSPTGIWHYMFADNALENGTNDIVGLGLTGRFAYNYIGGTELNAVDTDGVPIALMGMIDSATILVDFGSLNMDVDISFDNGSDFYRLVGSGNVDSFYGTGIFLDSTDGQGSVNGSISGTFVGQQAEGIISALTVSDFFNSYYYYGTAAFQSELTPARVFGGVSVLSDGFGRVTTIPKFWEMVVGENANGVFADQLQFGDFSTTATASGTAAAPNQQGGIDIYNTSGDAQSGVATEVYWGIWDKANYEVVDSLGNTTAPVSDWHYMVASNPLNEDMLLAIGLTGIYQYDYVGGTPLAEINGATADLAVLSGSFVQVDFDNLFAGGISAELNISGTVMTGSGSLFDLYGSGIGLTNAVDPLPFASLAGTFAGDQAQALVGAVSYDSNTESYYGTALFEKDPTPVVLP